MKKTPQQPHNKLQTKYLTLVFLLTQSLICFAKTPLFTKQQNFPPPRIIRTCCSFGADLGLSGIPFIKKTDITSIGAIGKHEYLGQKEEGNGNIYTHSGGFIDLGHLRDCADWTAYLYHLISTTPPTNKEINLDLGVEGGSKTLTISNFDNLAPQDYYQLAGKIAYDLSLWHEIATWFGASYIPFIPERYSSFSPEDLYSNLLGVTLGIQALKSNLEYDEAMTLLIKETLDQLGCVKTEQETYEAMEKVENIWWTNEKRLPSKKVLLKRFIDSDSILTPWLLPEDANRIQAHTLTKPANYLSNKYELKIKLNYKFPLKEISPDQNERLITQKDFDTLICHIVQDLDHLSLKTMVHSQKTKRKKEKIDGTRTDS